MQRPLGIIVLVAMIQLAVTSGAEAQENQYGQGLIMDLFVVDDGDDAGGPKGRSVATMIDPTPNTIGYLEPIDIEPALQQFRDKEWGLHSTGFIRIEDQGPHSFNIMQTSQRGYITCGSWLKIQDRIIASHELAEHNTGNLNQYGDVTLRPGIYAFEAWLGCTDGGRVSRTKPSLTINMRGPDDAMLRPIPNKLLLHEL